MGFGGGAIVGTPLKEFLIRFFYRAPQYLGQVANLSLTTEGGARFASIAGRLREVMIVGPNDVSQMLVRGPEGVYLLGTGRTGVAEAFLVLGFALSGRHDPGCLLLPHSRGALASEGMEPFRQSARGAENDQRSPRPHRRGRQDSAVLSSVDHPLLQCYGGNRGVGSCQDHDVGDFWNDAAEDRGCGLCGDLCSDDQHLQYGGTFLLGEHFRLHRPQSNLHAVFCRGDCALPVDSLHGPPGQRFTLERLAGLLSTPPR